jgi:anti-sigma regulatory factor (Ser/Thr protein kinase)
VVKAKPFSERMVTPQARQFDARVEPFSAVLEFIEDFCAGADVPDRTTENLILIVDELSANTVRHGYPSAREGQTEWPIWLNLSVSEREIVVGYEDAAPAHDSFDRIVPPDYSGPAETWRIGGWGIPLIARFASNLRYEHAGGRNRIHFTLPIDRPKE